MKKHSFKYYQLMIKYHQLMIKLRILSFTLDCYLVMQKCFHAICLVSFSLCSILGVVYLILKMWFENRILYKSSEECISELAHGYNRICNVFGLSFTDEEMYEMMYEMIRRNIR